MGAAIRSALITGSLCACAATGAHAGVIYSFSSITNTSATNSANGAAQLFMDVQAVGLTQVAFIFTNTGPAACSIADVYFDDGALLGISSITNGAGVDFSAGATPPNLPGANLISPAFVTTAGFSADSNPPVQPNGVNPGEMLTITFNLIGGMDYQDVIDGLNDGLGLRVGLHVQGFADGGSESFVNLMPAPGAAGLFGLAGLCAARRRRR